MSKYSMELRHILDSGFGLDIGLGVDDYEIFDEDYRAILNNKIKKHYYFCEIGFETADVFKHYLNTKMNEIMVYYNKLYLSELLEVNPLLNFSRTIVNEKVTDTETNQNINNETTLDNTTTASSNDTDVVNSTSTQTSELDSTKTGQVTNTQSDEDVFSDTPQGLLPDNQVALNDYATEARIKSATGLINDTESIDSDESVTKVDVSTTGKTSGGTNVVDTESTSHTDNDTIVSGTETLNITENGFNISLSELLEKYRTTFLNVDTMIINDLKDCFMMIY